VKVLIVDDQAATRSSLIRLCERRDDVQVVGEAACGTAAIDAAGPLNPDIVLLGVDLPDMSGFDLLRSVAADTRPLGIMASHYAGHANRAFEEGAFDYLVMPVAAERFDRAMTRARRRLNCAVSGFDRFIENSLESPRTLPNSPRFLVGERLRRLYPLDPKSIDYIEADGNYVTLRVGKEEYLSRDSIKRLALQLAELGFIRIERSLLVNATAIAYAEVARHGTFALTLSSGVCLHSSAAYRDSILQVIPLPALSKRYRGTVS
jgi:two-component system, LytTR family, response regulator